MQSKKSSYDTAFAALSHAQNAYARMKLLFERDSIPEIQWGKVESKLQPKKIDHFVINDALFLLKNSDRSIQQIAYDLNFPNQSFFGKFFKAYVGCSPNSFRSQSVTCCL